MLRASTGTRFVGARSILVCVTLSALALPAQSLREELFAGNGFRQNSDLFAPAGANSVEGCSGNDTTGAGHLTGPGFYLCLRLRFVLSEEKDEEYADEDRNSCNHGKKQFVVDFSFLHHKPSFPVK